MARRPKSIRTGSVALLFVTPPSGLVHEMDFIRFEYLLKDPQNQNSYIPVSLESTAFLILQPANPNNTPLTELLMRPIGSNDVPRPAHLPNYYDLYPITNDFLTFTKWCLGHEVNTTNIVPALHVLDPLPIINFGGPVFELERIPIRLCMATFTDGFQVLKVGTFPHVLHLFVSYDAYHDYVSGYHKVDFTPVGGAKAAAVVTPPCCSIPKNLFICCWNVRDIGRPSFVQNFQHLYDRHAPAVVVLLEVRQSILNVDFLVKEIPGAYSYYYSPTEGLCGGVVVLWRGDVLCADKRNLTSPFVKADIFFKGHPVSRRSLF